MRSSGIGGQAVMEGVMMKNKDKYAVAVRKPDKQIEVKVSEYKSLGERYPFFNVPIIRGVVAFIESLVIGMKTLTYSASFFDEEPDSSKKSSGKKANSSKKQADKKESEKKSETKEKVTMAATVVLSIVLAIGIFMMIPYFVSRALGGVVESEALLALFEGIIRVILFIGYIVAISQMNDIKRVFMYHGAEHKSINCIENGEDLTVENIKKHSRLHKRCGTSFLLVVMCVSIFLFMFIHTDIAWLRVVLRLVLVPVIAGISYEFIKLAGRSENKVITALSKPGLMLQKLTTREPDDDMIECAIKSVEAVFDWKKFVEEVKNGAEENAEEATAESTEKSTEESTTESTEKSAEESTKKSTKKNTKRNAEKRVEKRTEESTEVSTEKSETMSEENETEDASEPVAERVKAEPLSGDGEDDIDFLDFEFRTDRKAEKREETKSESKKTEPKKKRPVQSDRTQFGITPDDEEDDEILQKLDKFFVSRKKDNAKDE